MRLDYWLGKWVAGDTKFHLPDYHPALVKHFPAAPAGEVLVPLCGKSLDMLWLRDKGWKVTGIEASELACHAFFRENNIAFREEKRGAFTVFLADNITLWCGDLFAAKKGDLPAFTAVYDRAALIALPEDMRAQYAAHVKALVPAKGARYFLIAMEYPQEAAQGPPFSVPEDEVRRLFEKNFNVTLVRRRPDTVIPAINAKFVGVNVQETVYLLEGV